MTESFVDFLSLSRKHLDKDMSEFLEDVNDYMIEIAKFDDRGNPDLIQRGQVLITRLEAVRGRQ